MKRIKAKSQKCDWFRYKNGKDSSGSGIYCLGIIGAAVYYIQTATGFWMGAWGIVKAFLWPAFLIHDLMKFLGM
jgi:hypothetical protein